MPYSNWSEKTHDYLQTEQWARLDDLMLVFKYIRSAQLKYRSHRGEGLRHIRNLCKTYTIAQNARFPPFSLVNMTKSIIAELVMQLLKAIDVLEFDPTSQTLVTGLVKRFYESITTPNFNILVIYGVFNRKTFEKYHQLEWSQPESN